MEPVSSAALTDSEPSSRWTVWKCCSARVSVGAISAAWNPCSTARSIAYSAITVLPEPTSPISSRCIGSPLSDVGVDRLQGRALVTGQRERQLALQPARSQLPRSCQLRRRHARPAIATALRQRQLREQQLLEREPAARLLLILRRQREVRRPQGAGVIEQTLAQAQRGRKWLERIVKVDGVLTDEREDLRRGEPVGGRIVRDRVWRLPRDRRDLTRRPEACPRSARAPEP